MNYNDISEKEKEFLSLINKVRDKEKNKIKEIMKALKKSS